MVLNITNTFAPSTTISSSRFNTNFSDISTWANGNIQQDNFGEMTGEVEWALTGTSNAINISSTGVLASSKALIKVLSNSAQVNGDAIVDIKDDHASSTIPTVQITNDGSGPSLKVVSTTAGAITAPVMTSTQRDAIASPVEGMEIYNSSQKCKQVYTGTAWVNLGAQTGELISAGNTSTPVGYLACDGSAVSRTTYADLFAAISTRFGVGDNSTTFNVPDTRRKTLVGSGGTGTSTLANSVGSSGGAETHTLTVAEMPSHSHNFRLRTTDNGSSVYPTIVDLSSDQNTVLADPVAPTGGDGAHNNMQPSLVIAHYIKY